MGALDIACTVINSLNLVGLGAIVGQQLLRARIRRRAEKLSSIHPWKIGALHDFDNVGLALVEHAGKLERELYAHWALIFASGERQPSREVIDEVLRLAENQFQARRKLHIVSALKAARSENE